MNAEILAQTTAEFFFKWLMPQKKPQPEQKKNVKVIAHRGLYADHKENTLDGFKACAAAGIWGIEFDIRWTKDLVPIVYHDQYMTAANKQKIALNQLSYAQLTQLNCKIPSLAVVIKQVYQQCHLMIELKEPLNQKKAQILHKQLGQLQPKTHYHLMGLTTEILQSANQFPQECLLAVAIFNGRKILKDTVENNWGGMTGSHLLLTDSYKNKLTQLNKLFGTGYIDSRYALYREINRGVKYLYTNKPQLIMDLLDEI